MTDIPEKRDFFLNQFRFSDLYSRRANLPMVPVFLITEIRNNHVPVIGKIVHIRIWKEANLSDFSSSVPIICKWTTKLLKLMITLLMARIWVQIKSRFTSLIDEYLPLLWKLNNRTNVWVTKKPAKLLHVWLKWFDTSIT